MFFTLLSIICIFFNFFFQFFTQEYSFLVPPSQTKTKTKTRTQLFRKLVKDSYSLLYIVSFICLVNFSNIFFNTLNTYCVLLKMICFEIISYIWKSCKNSTTNFYISFTQLPQVLIFYHMYLIVYYISLLLFTSEPFEIVADTAPQYFNLCFAKNKGTWLHNHNIAIKNQEISIIQFHHLKHRPHSTFTFCSNDMLQRFRLQMRVICCLQFLCLLNLLQAFPSLALSLMTLAVLKSMGHYFVDCLSIGVCLRFPPN